MSVSHTQAAARAAQSALAAAKKELADAQAAARAEHAALLALRQSVELERQKMLGEREAWRAVHVERRKERAVCLPLFGGAEGG